MSGALINTADPLDGATLAHRLDTLGAISDEPDRLTRLYLSPAHRRAVECVRDWMEEAGLVTTLDDAATLIGRREGPPGAPTLLVGSHLDTVRNGGRFDGALGVVVAIAAMHDLHARAVALPFTVEVVAFGDEEGVRFASTLSGSKALAGVFDPASLDEVERRDDDADPIRRREALLAFGLDPSRIAALARDPHQTCGYVEVHIEQGPALEAAGLPLGIVTAINGASRGEVVVRGVAGHAGTLPMPMRRDALAAAAAMVLAVETCARAVPDLVATVGSLDVPGRAVNVVPGEVRFTLDVRAPTDVARHEAWARIEQAIAAIATDRAVTATVTQTYEAPATPCDPTLADRLAASLSALGVDPLRLPSGAGHDAMAFRDRIPAAMLFVRCRGGVSHNPAEYVTPADLELAARTLTHFLEHFGSTP